MYEIIRDCDGWIASSHKTLELAMKRWKKTSLLFKCHISGNDDDLQLLPCPFCGSDVRFVKSEDTFSGSDVVVCNKCGARMYTSNKFEWNIRISNEHNKERKDR